MIIYNVTVKVSVAIKDSWLEWMKQVHIPAIMETGLFHDYRICRLLEQDDTDGPTYAVQYWTDTLENYYTYLQEHAPRFRQQTFEMFGDQFVAFRTVMQVV
ncbi:DUF4286 domain-containing protein [Chitinophaga alhagiae]|uniref:DUF4286 domain-containing protein n=1 Tax=Chitinophaga alhagiae TaxID=2203219 RepID=A0ABM6WCH8_9BACT|nr:DUF4286 family protein [Chitinophaga alhagiae]AWO01643.1 DUF4286 domain-containing protein [Chitinophaga alhagiae]